MRARPSQPTIAYICSAYPAVSHTFVMREILALRRLGADVHTFTVRRTAPADLLSELDREEAARTGHLLPTSASTILLSLLRLLASPRGPAALLAGVREAWAMRRTGVRGTLWQAFYLVEAILLWASCSRRGIRHVHAHFANVASDVALLTAVLGTARTPHDPWRWSFTMHGSADFWIVDETKLAEKVRRAHLVPCISDFCRSQMMSLTETDCWERLRVVHCGLDLRSYEPRRAAPDDGEPLVLTVGRLVPAKGQLVLVEALARLRERGVAVRAEIVGGGPGREELERTIADRGLDDAVVLTGALGQDEIPERLRRATVFALPSFAEGLPVVAMEAMAVGVPVVTSRIAGIPELIEDGVSGLLTVPSRVDELVDAIARLLADPDLRSRIAVAAREQITGQFDADREADKLFTLFFGRPPLV